MQIEMKIKLLDKFCMPFKKHESDSGYDLKARIDKVISVSQHGTAKIPTGICIELPIGYEAVVRSRSSMYEVGMDCSGTIDNGYRGEIYVLLHNQTDQPYHVQPYQRIAQLVVQQVIIPSLYITTELSATERGTDGFGSTNEVK